MKKLITAFLLLASAGCVSTENIKQYKPMEMEGMFRGNAVQTIDFRREDEEPVRLEYTGVFVSVTQVGPSMQFWGLTALPLSNEIVINYDELRPTFILPLWMDQDFRGEFTGTEGEINIKNDFKLVDLETNEVQDAGGNDIKLELSDLVPFVLGEDSLFATDQDPAEARSLPEIVRSVNNRPDILSKSVSKDLSISYHGVIYKNIDEAIAASQE